MKEKSIPCGIALRRKGRMPRMRPAVGGESCEQDSFLFHKEIASYETKSPPGRMRTDARGKCTWRTKLLSPSKIEGWGS
jgi:hypothetical protein